MLAFPMAAYFNPMVYGGPTGADFGAWVFARLFIDLKMMAIFSMLFGAGVILITERAHAAGRPFGGIYYRRTFWLLVIGLVHSYLVWHGDILVTYALCGFLLYLFRKRSSRALIISGLTVLVFGALLSASGGFAMSKLRDEVVEIHTRVEAGEQISPRWRGLVDRWEDVRHDLAPTPEETAEKIATMSGSAGEVLGANVRETIGMHTDAMPFFLFWRAMALMLLGMGLMKAGVFTVQRSPGF